MDMNDNMAIRATLYVPDSTKFDEVIISWAHVQRNVASLAPRFFLEHHAADSLEAKVLMNVYHDLAYTLVLRPFGLTYEQYLLPWTVVAVREHSSELQRSLEKLNLLAVEPPNPADIAQHRRIDDYYDAVIAWRREHTPRNTGLDIRICTSGKAQKTAYMALDEAKAIWQGGRDEIQNFDIKLERTLFSYFSLKLAEDVGIQLRRLESLYILAVEEEMKKTKDMTFRNGFVLAWHKSTDGEDLYLCSYEELARWKMLVERFIKLKARADEYSECAESVASHADTAADSEARLDVSDEDAASEASTELVLFENKHPFYPADWFDYVSMHAAQKLDGDDEDPWGGLYPWVSCHDCSRYDDKNMVQCEGYHQKKTWFHHGCAQIKEVADDTRWVCRTCEAADEDSKQRHAATKTTASPNTFRLADTLEPSSEEASDEGGPRCPSLRSHSSAKLSRVQAASTRTPTFTERVYESKIATNPRRARESATLKAKIRAPDFWFPNPGTPPQPTAARSGSASTGVRGKVKRTKNGLGAARRGSVSSVTARTQSSLSPSPIFLSVPVYLPLSSSQLSAVEATTDDGFGGLPLASIEDRPTQDWSATTTGHKSDDSASAAAKSTPTKEQSIAPPERRATSDSYQVLAKKRFEQPVNLHNLRDDLAGMLDTRRAAFTSGGPNTVRLGNVLGAWKKGLTSAGIQDKAVESSISDGKKKRKSDAREAEDTDENEMPESASKKTKFFD